MQKIIGISGSLRRNSFNTGLLQAMIPLIPTGAVLEVHTLHGIPLYDGDLEESDGIPTRVTELGQLIAEADGIILSTPEYNNSIPGVFKNGIDWLSRLEGDIFAGKPLALLGASPGGFGTLLSQAAWLPVLRTLETNFWTGGRLQISKVSQLFDADGHLTDPNTQKKLEAFLKGFVSYIATQRPGVAS